MSGVTLTLEARLDLRAASALAKELMVHRGKDLTLDAKQVKQIGALTVQAVRAAARTWSKDGHSLTLTNASNGVADQLVLLGFAPETLTHWEASQ